MSKTVKDLIPAWMVPGVRVRVNRGRAWPIGVTGTVLDTYKTGSGARAHVLPDSMEWWDAIHPDTIEWVQKHGVPVWVTNLEKV